MVEVCRMNSIKKKVRGNYSLFFTEHKLWQEKNRAAVLKLIKLHTCTSVAELDVS